MQGKSRYLRTEKNISPKAKHEASNVTACHNSNIYTFYRDLLA